MMLLVAIVLALAAAYALTALNFPAGALIGAMVAIGALKLTGHSVTEVPSALRFVALMVIGWDLGTRLDRQLVVALGDDLVLLVVIVGAFLIFGWVFAWGLWKAGLLDPATAVLATSPGGLVQMGALTAAMEVNAAFVVGVHLLRVVSVLLSVPLISRLASS